MTEIDIKFMKKALELSKKCSKTDKAYSVGVIIVDKDNKIISTGYSREVSDNVHAEEVALNRLENQDINFSEVTIYSTMEPCGQRLSGKLCCADRIINSGIKRVVYGIDEPNDFVENTIGIKKLTDNKIVVDKIDDENILSEITKINSVN